MGENFLQNALIYLGTALVCVPISKKLGIGSVLGYLIGGILVGPFLLGLIGTEGHDVMHTAEFGVVMMLFVIGLELNPTQFWNIRKLVLGLGGLQVTITAIFLYAFFYYGLSLTISSSIALALAFALSSTAIVMQTLREKNLDKTQAGVNSFAVLLFQDIAVIPILAVFPFLVGASVLVVSEKQNLPEFLNIFEQYPTLLLLLAVGFVYLLSRYFAPIVLRTVAKAHMRELFTAAALFFVLSISWIMELVGLSAALGAFMAGILLASSEFRHELQADIEPFKGLLMGVFFTAVGSTINFDIIASEPLKIFGVVLALMAIKWLVLYILSRFFGLISDQKILFAFLLAQIGEFAFILIGSMRQLNIIEAENVDFFMAVVTISMIFSPIFLFLNERILAPRFGVKEKAKPSLADNISGQNDVIILGYGEFGSMLGRFLKANGICATVIDNDSNRVVNLRKMGLNVFYGDGTRLDLLTSAGAHQAKALILAVGDPAGNAEVIDIVKKHFPHLKLFVRAKNYFEVFDLIESGIECISRQYQKDSVYLGVDVLRYLGIRKDRLNKKAQNFIKYDNESTQRLAKIRNEKTFLGSLKDEIAIQEKLVKEDILFAESQEKKNDILSSQDK